MNMDQLIAFKCLECGHYTITKHDGMKCAKCGGVITPVGEATYIDKRKLNSISFNVELSGCDKIKNQLSDIETQLDRINQKSEKLKMVKQKSLSD